jgi:hypothetical protein
MFAEQGDGPPLVLYQTSLSLPVNYWTMSCACAVTAARRRW